MMNPEKAVGMDTGSDMREPSKKEWRRPGLRKLPIKATAASDHITGDDGNMKKVGHAGNFS